MEHAQVRLSSLCSDLLVITSNSQVSLYRCTVSTVKMVAPRPGTKSRATRYTEILETPRLSNIFSLWCLCLTCLNWMCCCFRLLDAIGFKTHRILAGGYVVEFFSSISLQDGRNSCLILPWCSQHCVAFCWSKSESYRSLKPAIGPAGFRLSWFIHFILYLILLDSKGKQVYKPRSAARAVALPKRARGEGLKAAMPKPDRKRPVAWHENFASENWIQLKDVWMTHK